MRKQNKTIRLTESDLTRVVKNIIEQKNALFPPEPVASVKSQVQNIFDKITEDTNELLFPPAKGLNVTSDSGWSQKKEKDMSIATRVFKFKYPGNDKIQTVQIQMVGRPNPKTGKSELKEVSISQNNRNIQRILTDEFVEYLDTELPFYQNDLSNIGDEFMKEIQGQLRFKIEGFF
jgi:hypothetical protein